MEPNRNDFRRSVERDNVHDALQHTLGVMYPNDRPVGVTVELQSCSLCGRQYQRAVGSGMLFCHECVGKMR